MLRPVTRRSIRAVAAAAALSVLAATVPAPASAIAIKAPVRETWTVAPCATGALTGVHSDNGWAVITGSATNCGAYQRAASFVIVVLEPEQQAVATVSPLGWRAYQRSGPTEFGYAATRTPGPVIACLASSPLRVLGCAEVTLSADGRTTFRPLPADDPRIVDLLIITGLRSDEDTHPRCGTCF
jgi:hypothetical protein